MSTICIAMHDGMLAAALAVPRLKPWYNVMEAKKLRQERYRAGNTPYPSWYLFGSEKKQVTGLVKQYSDIGLDVSLCPESALPGCNNASFLDVQFCTVSKADYRKLLNSNVRLYGYLPESHSSKSVQAENIFKRSGFRFLPIQHTYDKNSMPILPESETGAWIIKSTVGSAGFSQDGIPYTVWTSKRLKKELPALIASLSYRKSLIISEFVETNDPFAGHADHVVHKAHFYTIEIDGEVLTAPFGTCCQKHIFRCDKNKLQESEILPLIDYIGSPEYQTGQLNKISALADFIEQLNFLNYGGAIFSADFIVPTDGIPRFLELNKIAATFAEKFHPGLPAIIDFYPQLNYLKGGTENADMPLL